ncbi:hypothetical protein [Bradyrhizobium roseum]|uniref:hypothetical protein n=1 Tax=Bradyrhizobium roseum TaxID=3056648 RepID=UPI0026131492|nr:hypothetical protein [Bradyrhizobium roseus]WKA30472.1 hypothetical protein QUH67_10045 [Bradyrhizobium roseus]
MSRANPAMIPSPFEPIAGTQTMPVNIGEQSAGVLGGLLTNNMTVPASNIAGHALHLYNLRNPAHLPNVNDEEPSRIYALNGSITGSVVRSSGSFITSSITANEPTWFRAGTDIRNIDYALRNIRPTDVSVIEAGNDIIGGPVQGSVTVQGPGALLVSPPILSLMSVGNRTFDANNCPVDYSQVNGLPSQNAAITVMAGLKGKQPSYEAFLAGYLDPANVGSMPDYLVLTPAEAALPDPATLIPGVKMTSVIGDSAVPLCRCTWRMNTGWSKVAMTRSSWCPLWRARPATH